MPFSGRSIPDLFNDVVIQLSALLRKEGQLARSEISENVGRMAAGLGLIVGGAVLLTPALVVLLQAAIAALVERGQTPPWAAALIVGGVVLLIGAILLLVGVNRLRAERMIPSRTINQLQQDASVAKEQVRPGHDINRAA